MRGNIKSLERAVTVLIVVNESLPTDETDLSIGLLSQEEVSRQCQAKSHASQVCLKHKFPGIYSLHLCHPFGLDRGEASATVTVASGVHKTWG